MLLNQNRFPISLFAVWLTMSQDWGSNAKEENCFEIWLCFLLRSLCFKRKYVPSVSNLFFDLLSLTLFALLSCYPRESFSGKCEMENSLKNKYYYKRREAFFVFFSPYFLKVYCVSFTPPPKLHQIVVWKTFTWYFENRLRNNKVEIHCVMKVSFLSFWIWISLHKLWSQSESLEIKLRSERIASSPKGKLTTNWETFFAVFFNLPPIYYATLQTTHELRKLRRAKSFSISSL